MASNPLYDEFARMIAGPNPGQGPRAHPAMMMLGSVDAANPYQSTLAFNAGGGLVIPDIAYVQAYGPDQLPRKGDAVVMHLLAGAAPYIAGRFVTPGQLGGVLT